MTLSKVNPVTPVPTSAPPLAASFNVLTFSFCPSGKDSKALLKAVATSAASVTENADRSNVLAVPVIPFNK